VPPVLSAEAARNGRRRTGQRALRVVERTGDICLQPGSRNHAARVIVERLRVDRRIARRIELPWFEIAPPVTCNAPLLPITPPATPVPVLPDALTSVPVVVTVNPSLPSDAMRPAVLSSDPAATLSCPLA